MISVGCVRLTAVLLLLLVLHASATHRPAHGEPVTGEAGSVAVIPIDGPIDRIRFRYLESALSRVKSTGVKTVIVTINTDGGAVYYARQMLKQILDLAREEVRTIAMIDFRAISAGALIAYGHEQVYLSDTATIGDIGVIFVQPGEGVQFASEKFETVVRALLAQASEQNGWPRGLLLKMTARNQILYRVSKPEGGFEFVIQDDWPEYLAAHPDLDQDTDVIEFRGEDRLLTLTGREAVKYGMATGLVADLQSLYAELSIDPSAVVDLSPGILERVAGLVAGWAPLLAGLALLFLLLELKTPGVGLFALLGLSCGFLFLIAQYTFELVNSIELVVLVIGLLLLVVEMLTFAGGGLIGLAGIAAVAGGLLLAFLPNEFDFDIADEQFMAALRLAGLQMLIAVGILAIGLIGFIVALPNSRLARKIAVTAEISATSSGPNDAAARQLVGHHGVCHDALRPAGIVIVDGRSYGARSQNGVALEAGQNIRVVQVEFGDLVVAPLVAKV